MSGGKIVGKVLAFISSLLLIVVLFLTSVEMNAFNLKFFQNEYQKLQSTEVIGISEEDLMRTTEGLLAYIKSERNNLDIRAEIKGEERAVFNSREINHMVDVQRLYTVSHKLRNAALILFAIVLVVLRLVTGRNFLRYEAGGFLAGTVVFLCLMGLITIAISRDFLWFWNQFHTVVFTNDLWLLNPETDILIQMVPEQFFFDLVSRILISFSLAVGIIAILSGMVIRKTKNRGF
jgi:integral membrane protein (TIGR01906 family)